MKISKVFPVGIDQILSLYLEAGDSSNIGLGFDFSAHMGDVLSHLSVSYLISEVNGLEMMFLKKFASKVTVLNEYVVNTLETVTPDSDLYGPLATITTIYHEIEKDSDIDNSLLEGAIIPLVLQRYDIIVEFQGMNITAITGAAIKKLFEMTPIKNPNDKPKLKEKYNEKYTCERLEEFFYSNFISFMHRKISDSDMLCDFILHKRYYNATDAAAQNVALEHINTPAGSIRFIDVTPDVLTIERNKWISFKNGLKGSPVLDSVLEDISLYFAITLPIGVYLDLLVHLPQQYLINDMSDIKILSKELSTIYPEDIFSKYSVRLDGAVNDIFKKLEGMNDPKYSIKKFAWVNESQLVSISLKINLVDVDYIENDIDNLKSQFAKEIMEKVRVLAQEVKNSYI